MTLSFGWAAGSTRIRLDSKEPNYCDAVIILTQAGRRQKLFDAAGPGTTNDPALVVSCDEPHFTVHWAGDLDRDGRLDMVVMFSHKYSYHPRQLFLSSGARSDELIAEVARYDQFAERLTSSRRQSSGQQRSGLHAEPITNQTATIAIVTALTKASGSWDRIARGIKNVTAHRNAPSITAWSASTALITTPQAGGCLSRRALGFGMWLWAQQLGARGRTLVKYRAGLEVPAAVLTVYRQHAASSSTRQRGDYLSGGSQVVGHAFYRDPARRHLPSGTPSCHVRSPVALARPGRSGDGMPSPDRIATVHANGRAGDEVRRVRGQVHGGSGNLFRLSPPARGGPRQNLCVHRDHRGRAHRRCHVGFNPPWCNGVDLNVVRRQFDGHRLGQLDNRPFCGAVGRNQPGTKGPGTCCRR